MSVALTDTHATSDTMSDTRNNHARRVRLPRARALRVITYVICSSALVPHGAHADAHEVAPRRRVQRNVCAVSKRLIGGEFSFRARHSSAARLGGPTQETLQPRRLCFGGRRREQCFDLFECFERSLFACG